MKAKIFFLAMLLLLSQTLLAQPPEWFTKIRSVELLKDTRQDIIRLFGESNDDNSPYFVRHQLKDGEMTVEYSRGMCGINYNTIGWNVPEFTVTRIFFDPSKSFTPKELKLKLKNFRKKEVSDSPGNFHYESDDAGIYFDVNSNGKISSLEFRPTSKFDSLYCK